MPEHSPAPTPHRAVYGFAWFLLFKTLFFVYLIWAFVPDSILENTFGLIYVPDKYFAIQLPVVVMTALMFFGFGIYPAWNLAMTYEPDDVRTIWDRFSIHRCQRILESGTKCDRKVQLDRNRGWEIPTFCTDHSSSDQQVNSDTVDDQKNIENYCDCLDKSKCFLTEHPNHVNVLRSQKTVPSACDLDLSDVCRIMFRNKK